MSNPLPDNDDKQTLRRQKIAGAVTIAVIVLIVLALGWLVGRPLVQALKNKESFRGWIDAQGDFKYFIMCGLMILQIIIAVIPNGAIEVAAGYAFGAWLGTLICVLGSLLGSALVFWLSRKYGIKLVSIFVPREKLNAVKLLQNRKKFNLALFVIYLVPGMPKDILTYLSGLTPIKMSLFLMITVLARFPAILLSNMTGHNIGEENYRAIIIIVLVALVLGGLLSYLYSRHSKAKDAQQDKGDGHV